MLYISKYVPGTTIPGKYYQVFSNANSTVVNDSNSSVGGIYVVYMKFTFTVILSSRFRCCNGSYRLN